MFKIGEKVVCVDDSAGKIGVLPIKNGEIYVIRGFDPNPYNSEIGVWLVGVHLPLHFWTGEEHSFRYSRFRKLSDMQAEARERRKERQPA